MCVASTSACAQRGCFWELELAIRSNLLWSGLGCDERVDLVKIFESGVIIFFLLMCHNKFVDEV